MMHAGHSHSSRWTSTDIWNGITIAFLLAIPACYVAGLRRLWTTAAGRTTIPVWRAAAFALGIASAAIALLSPIDRWSDILFSAHMAQHEILMLISAPLIVLGRPFIVMLWGLPASQRRSIADFTRRPIITRSWIGVSAPLTVLILHAVVLWVWHVPVMYEAALHSETVHVMQHLGFFGTAALFWWSLIHGRYGRIGYGIGVAYVFATAMHTQILGALLTFGSRLWYPTHAARTAAAGVSAHADQQLAGVVMWIPFGVVFLLIALALFAAWLGEAERRVMHTTSEQLGP
jgi:putative membrane protein